VLDAGIVDEDVRRTELVSASPHHILNLRRIGQIGAVMKSAELAPGLLDLGGIAEAVEHDPGAFGS
jgi:hypothetical protein